MTGTLEGRSLLNKPIFAPACRRPVVKNDRHSQAAGMEPADTPRHGEATVSELPPEPVES